MNVKTWCESYHKTLGERGSFRAPKPGECGCPHVTKLPWLSIFTDDDLSEKMADHEKDDYKNMAENDIADVFSAAARNVYSGGSITRESVNDLFMSLEQPLYDNIVRLFLVPQRFEDDLCAAVQSTADRTPDGIQLWTAAVRFVDSGDDLLAVVGSSGLIHGFRVAETKLDIDLSKRPVIDVVWQQSN